MTSEPQPFAGRVVVVAGASSGIGQATAAMLISRGAQVHALARRVPDVGGATAHAVDVTDRAAVDATVRDELLPALLSVGRASSAR